MDENINMERNEKIFDALLRVAAEEVMKEEIATMPSIEELNKLHPSSDALNKRIQIIINREKRAVARKLVLRGLGKVVAAIGILFTLCTVILMSVEASRNFIFNTIINIQDDHVTFEFGERGQEVEIAGIMFRYIPYGFELLNSHTIGRLTLNTFTNAADEQIIIQQSFATSVATSVDNEAREFSRIIFEGQEMFIFESIDTKDQNVVMRQIESDVFTITSNLSINTLAQILLNIGN